MKTDRMENPFTQRKIRRALQAARKAGLTVRGFRLGLDGSIVVETAANDNVPALTNPNEASRDLKGFLDKVKGLKGDG